MLNRKTKSTKIPLIYVGLFIILLATSLFVYSFLSDKREKKSDLPRHVVPYVDGNAAVKHVDSFYSTLINSSDRIDQNKIVEIYGSRNLEFYNQYYQHGFNPVVCNVELPIKVTSYVAYTGPTAVIDATAEYQNGSSETIRLTVVLGNEGMEIDSITCPGEKGNLPPPDNT